MYDNEERCIASDIVQSKVGSNLDMVVLSYAEIEPFLQSK